MDHYNDRIYIFGTKKVYGVNGQYLSADRIKHYEDIYGTLISVTYKGRKVIPNSNWR